MTVPSAAAWRFAAALLLGLGLGVWYSFLRPLRQKRNAPADLLFILGFAAVWVWHSFAVCLGDIRIAGMAGLLLGCFAWEKTAGKWLRPVFFGFWATIGRVFGVILLPVRKIFEKICKFTKILFAYRKKSGTIKSSQNGRRKKAGGRHYASTLVETDPFGLPSQQHPGKGNRPVRYRVVYGGTADDPQRH